MASIINAATSGGLVTSADTSGILQLQTAGTTAVTVSAAQIVSTTNGMSIQGLTVGYGAGNVNTSTVLGFQAALLSTTTNSVSVGYQAHYRNLTGNNCTAVGHQALYGGASADADGCVAIGHLALTSVTLGDFNTAVGMESLKATTSGGNNTAVGYQAGYDVTSGANNTIVGGYTGNMDGLDIRTASNYAVIADGVGNRQITMKEGQTLALDSAVPNAGTGITFPATQSASSNANTLDDYEEGTWTPTFNLDSGSATTTTALGNYIKIGKQVSVTMVVTFSVPSAADINEITGLPFTVESSQPRGTGAIRENANTGFTWLLRANNGVTTAMLRRYDGAQAITNGMQFIGLLTYFAST